MTRLRRTRHGDSVFLRDLWPTDSEVDAVVRQAVTPDVFTSTARPSALVKTSWESLASEGGVLFQWDEASSYIVEPPFFTGGDTGFATGDRASGMRVLGIYGDDLNTDHVSPGGEIPPDSPAGQYLQSVGVRPAGFNSYVGRRGNHHVMMRGTYGNVRIRNRMAGDRDGWWTRIYPEGDPITIPNAAMRYRERGTPLIVLGGYNFGAGSSRDWAAKGPALLGVRAVIARSYERIHRSNLIGVGIVPLLFAPEQGVDVLDLDGSEEFSFDGVPEGIANRSSITVVARRSSGADTRFEVNADVRSAAEADLLRRGGIFQASLEKSST